MSEIATERLMLRTVPVEIAIALLSGQTTPGWQFAAGYPSQFSLEVMQMVADAADSQQPGPGDLTPPFFIIRRSDNLVIGEIGHVWSATEGSAQIGYSLVEPAWAQGYATEALQALTARLFEFPDVRRVFADTLVDHVASRRVMEKAGLSYSRQFQAEDEGQVLDLVTYQILRPS